MKSKNQLKRNDPRLLSWASTSNPSLKNVHLTACNKVLRQRLNPVWYLDTSLNEWWSLKLGQTVFRAMLWPYSRAPYIDCVPQGNIWSGSTQLWITPSKVNKIHFNPRKELGKTCPGIDIHVWHAGEGVRKVYTVKSSNFDAITTTRNYRLSKTFLYRWWLLRAGLRTYNYLRVQKETIMKEGIKQWPTLNVKTKLRFRKECLENASNQSQAIQPLRKASTCSLGARRNWDCNGIAY